MVEAPLDYREAHHIADDGCLEPISIGEPAPMHIRENPPVWTLLFIAKWPASAPDAAAARQGRGILTPRHQATGVSGTAGGSTKDGTVQEQIDASVEDPVKRARSRPPRDKPQEIKAG